MPNYPIYAENSSRIYAYIVTDLQSISSRVYAYIVRNAECLHNEISSFNNLVHDAFSSERNAHVFSGKKKINYLMILMN